MSDSTADLAKSQRRPVGRPRSDGKPHLTRQRVFETSAKLIAEHGFAGASIRKMATALDASPASLFNLFGSKDGLLNELVAYAAQFSFDFYDALKGVEAAPEVLLYKSIYEEVTAVSSADRDFVAIFYLPELRKPEFKVAQGVRARMVARYAELIDQCVKGGILQTGNVQLAAEQIVQLTETSILAPHLNEELSPDIQSRETADFCLRALQLDEHKLASVRQAAAGIDLKIDVPVS